MRPSSAEYDTFPTKMRPDSNSGRIKSLTYINSSNNARTILVVEGREIEIENKYIGKSPYIGAIKSKVGENEVKKYDLTATEIILKELRIILPKWVTLSSLTVIIFYLMYDKLDDKVTYSDSMMQILLWLSDFLQLENFQGAIIKTKIIPSLGPENVLLFLNEAFKKLKFQEGSSNEWHKLLNESLNIASQNLTFLIKSKLNELETCNEKLIQEMVGRSIRLNREFMSVETDSQLKLLINVMKKQNIAELIADQREWILRRKINDYTNPSIYWSFKNVLQMSVRRSPIFKLGGFYWNLTAVTTREKKFVELLLESKSAKEFASSQNINNRQPGEQFNFQPINELQFCGSFPGTYPTMDQEKTFEGVIALYYGIKAHGGSCDTTYTSRCFSLQAANSILIEKCYVSQNSEDSFEVLIHLNINPIYSAALTQISRNPINHIENRTILKLDFTEIQAIASDAIHRSQDNSAELIIYYCDNNYLLSPNEIVSLLSLVDWNQIKPQELDRLMLGRKYLRNAEVSKFLEKLKPQPYDFRVSGSQSSVYHKPDPLRSSLVIKSSQNPAVEIETLRNNSMVIAQSGNSSHRAGMGGSKTELKGNGEKVSGRQHTRSSNTDSFEEDNRAKPSAYGEILSRTFGTASLKQQANSIQNPQSQPSQLVKDGSIISESFENIEEKEESFNPKVPLTNFSVCIPSRKLAPSATSVIQNSNRESKGSGITNLPSKESIVPLSSRDVQHRLTYSSGFSPAQVKDNDPTPKSNRKNLNLGSLFRSQVLDAGSQKPQAGTTTQTQRLPGDELANSGVSSDTKKQGSQINGERAKPPLNLESSALKHHHHQKVLGQANPTEKTFGLSQNEIGEQISATLKSDPTNLADRVLNNQNKDSPSTSFSSKQVQEIISNEKRLHGRSASENNNKLISNFLTPEKSQGINEFSYTPDILKYNPESGNPEFQEARAFFEFIRGLSVSTQKKIQVLQLKLQEESNQKKEQTRQVVSHLRFLHQNAEKMFL